MNASRQVLTQGQRQLTRRSSSIARICARTYATSTTTTTTTAATPTPTTSTSTSTPSPSNTSAASSPKPAPIKFTPTASKWQKGSKAAEPTPVPEDLIYKPKTNLPWATATETSSSGQDDAAANSSESSATTTTAATVGIDWTRSFHGISARPVTEEQYAALTKPLDERDIEVKPDGVIYLPEIKYRRRLNEAFGPMGWGIIPRGDAVAGDSIVTREYAMIVNGRFASQAQGENSFFSSEQLPSAVEGCKSNALMRCCKDLGVASELWDPTFVRWFKKNRMEEVWVEHVTTKKKRTLWYRKGAVEVAYPYRATSNK